MRSISTCLDASLEELRRIAPQFACGFLPPERLLPHDCPASLVEFWSETGGQSGDSLGALIGGFRIMGPSESMLNLNVNKALLDEEVFGEGWWEVSWFPFARASNGDMLCIDATDGSVVEFLHADWMRRRLAESLLSYLDRFHLLLKSGKVKKHERFAYLVEV